MNKIIGLAVLLLCVCGCAKDDDAIYYPVGNVDIERGDVALEDGKGELVAGSYNEEDYVLDTLAQYPGDPTLGKLTFMIDLKNQLARQEAGGFNGIGKSGLTMSLGYKNGDYPSESQIPVYTSPDVTAAYAVKLRLKGELALAGDEWMIDTFMCNWLAYFNLIRLRPFLKCLCVKVVSRHLLLLTLFVGLGHLILLIAVPVFLSVSYISIYS